EDGIRVRNVTGVQTCALPIFSPHRIPLNRSEREGTNHGIAYGVAHACRQRRGRRRSGRDRGRYRGESRAWQAAPWPLPIPPAAQIGRASCRERGEAEGGDGVT